MMLKTTRKKAEIRLQIAQKFLKEYLSIYESANLDAIEDAT